MGLDEKAPQAGIWRHYKGPLYQVFGLAHDANQEDRVAVVYIGLELDSAHLGPRLAVRTLEDFNRWVNPETGETTNYPRAWHAHSGWRPRFTYLGPVLTAEMLPSNQTSI